MFGSEILDLAIGLILVYLLMAIICSALREAIESWLKTRSSYLEFGIRELLHDRDGTGLTAQLYAHPLIYSLFRGDYRPPEKSAAASGTPPMRTPTKTTLPSYIPAETFAVALMDIAARGPRTDAISTDPTATRMSADSIRSNIANLDNEPVQRIVLTALDNAGDSLAAVRANLESWYNGAMDRISGWYTRSTKKIIFAIALVVTVIMNVNTITIADYLVRNDTARSALASHAAQSASDGSLANAGYERAQAEIKAVSLPIGWSGGWGAPLRGDEPGSEGLWNDLAAPILGWLITALAAAMGAPFWFDLLNKVSVIRATVKPREKSRDEGSEDRRAQPAYATAGPAPAIWTAGTTAAMTSSPAANATPHVIGAGTEVAAGPWTPSTIVPVATPADEDTGVDCCTSRANEPVTTDEELPQADGGVAS